uniref:Uncharacterized protein n=1 Tax=Cacopsylla melanoneura TaxID=428564 RepID=A0A8D9F0Y1_9HEMI
MLLHLAEQCGVNVTYRGENQNLTLFVVPRGRSILIGRDWLVNLKVDLNELSNMCSLSLLDGKKLFNDFPDEFSEKLGCVKQKELKIRLKGNQYETYLSPVQTSRGGYCGRKLWMEFSCCFRHQGEW